MQLPPKVTPRAFARLAEIGASGNTRSSWTSPLRMIWCWKAKASALWSIPYRCRFWQVPPSTFPRN